MFVMMPDDRVLGVFSSGGGPVAKMINTDASVQMVYVPSDPATSSSVIGGVAYDIARERIYFSCCHTGGGGFMGILMAFDVKDGSTTLWSTPIPTVTSNAIGKVCMCPPLGSPQSYNPTTTTTEALRCMRVCPILSHENVRTVFDELWVDVETGQAVVGDGDMTFWVAMSRDSGHTFGPAFAIQAGRQGQYQWRVIRRRLGQSRNMVFKIWTDSPAGQAWLQAILKVRPGTSYVMPFQPLGPAPIRGPLTASDFCTPVWQQWFDALRELVSPGQAFTPATAPLLNIDSVSAATCWFQKRGNIVNVFGQFSADATAAGNTAFYMDLPIAADLVDQYDLSGTATTNGANESARVYGDFVTNRAVFNWPATSTVPISWSFQFSYVLR
jgi:hypothetical protein